MSNSKKILKFEDRKNLLINSSPASINAGYHGTALLSSCKAAFEYKPQGMTPDTVARKVNHLHHQCLGHICIPFMNIDVTCSCPCHLKSKKE